LQRAYPPYFGYVFFQAAICCVSGMQNGALVDVATTTKGDWYSNYFEKLDEE